MNRLSVIAIQGNNSPKDRVSLLTNVCRCFFLMASRSLFSLALSSDSRLSTSPNSNRKCMSSQSSTSALVVKRTLVSAIDVDEVELQLLGTEGTVIRSLILFNSNQLFKILDNFGLHWFARNGGFSRRSFLSKCSN